MTCDKHSFASEEQICRMAFFPFREWHYFEGQLELLSELKRYLDEFADSDYGEMVDGCVVCIINHSKRY
jgi:hypothetical protein